MIDTLFKTIITNNEEKYCVYCHRNKINGKRYIGQSCEVDKRWRGNGCNYKGSTHFYNAINKYGWDNFDHYIIQDNLTKEEADELEKLNILAFNTTNPNFGYNLQSGGHKFTMNDETKKKISESHKGEKNNFYGKQHSEESKQKMSEAKKGNTYSLGIKRSEKAKQTMSKAQKQRYLDEEQRRLSGVKNIGRITINNGKQIKHIYKEELEYYLNKGYVIGTIQKNSLGKKWINNGKKETYINVSDLNKYISQGYVLGRLKRV